MEKRSARGKRHHTGYDFSKSIENIKNRRFNFGSWNREAMTVDLELASLFECLSVECSNVLVHPQWKHFSHIEIVKNDQFRLSNGIWRSWHLQFQKGRVPRFCVFDINPHLDHHKNAASVVLEGKYWKRKVEAVAREYRKWRLFHRDQNRLITKREPWLDELLERAHGDELGDGSKSVPQAMQVDPQRPTFIEDFPDAFFLNIQQDSPSGPAMYTSTADVIPQPNLDMLNPMLEDLLDKFEPMEGMLSRSMGAVGSFFSATNSFNTPPLRPDMPPFSQQLPTPMQTSEQFAGSSDPPKPLAQTQSPFASQYSSLGGYTATRGMVADQQYILSPSSFLTIPSEEPKGREPLIESSMEIGAPQIPNYAMKPEPSIDAGTSMSTCTHSQVTFDTSIPAFQSQRQPLSTPTPTPTPTLTPTLTPTPPSQHYAAMNDSGMALQDGVCSMAADSSAIRDSQQQKDPAIASLLGLFGADSTVPQQQPPAPVQSPPLGSTPLTHMTSKRLGPQEASQSQQGSGIFQFPQPIQPQQSPFKAPQQHATNLSPLSSHSFIRVSSAGSLTAVPTRPPLERGSSEPTHFLQEQVRKLSEQQEQQRKEIEKHHSLAEQQYKDLMQQYLSQKPSEQQQQVLQSVLADPSLLNLLRSLLLSTALPTGASLPGKLAISPQTSSKSHLTQQASPPGQMFALPTQLAKVNVSSFPGMLAAATNTNSNSANAATALATPVTPQIKSPFKEPDASLSPKMFPFVPQILVTAHSSPMILRGCSWLLLVVIAIMVDLNKKHWAELIG